MQKVRERACEKCTGDLKVVLCVHYSHPKIGYHVSFKGINKHIIWCRNTLYLHFNSFPHDKCFDQNKLKAFADDKLNITKMKISVFDRVENIVGKGEIASTSNFSFSHNVFKGLLSQTC